LTTFDSLNLSAPILNAVKAEGYEVPTPIQAQAIPYLLAGRDLLGIAQTGTGKTAAFALPILETLSRENRKPERGTCRSLILAPTRELCSQILESFKVYGKNVKLSRTVVFGGVGIGRQIDAARAGVDIMVATPGRLVDLIERKALSLSKVEIFVLDEVDQMLDLGFIHAIRRITGLLPKKRQNLFFSATMPKEIAGLAANLLSDPARVEITPVATTAERVTQSVIHVDPGKKVKLLTTLLGNPQITRALVFTRTKHGADKVVKALIHDGIEAAAIHGNKSQSNRERALAGFKNGKVLALVATDIAARGIDVDGVSHVFNYDLPYVPESYVHRIGRTARAGATGEAIAFCTPEERGLLRDIERTIRQPVPVQEHELSLQGVAELAPGHGWSPTGDRPRKSGGGRHMPKSAKKPHRGQGGERSEQRGERRSDNRGGPRKSHGGEGKREWMPTEPISQSQFTKPADHAPAHDRNDQPRQERAERPERLRHERPHADRSPADRSAGERKHEARPHGERPHGERKHADRPHGERKQGERKQGDRPFGERKAAGDRPHGERKAGDRSHPGRGPHGERSHGGERAASGQPEKRAGGKRPFKGGKSGPSQGGQKPSGGGNWMKAIGHGNKP
jgi:ATP-dependent RNA helicase RhlE